MSAMLLFGATKADRRYGQKKIMEIMATQRAAIRPMTAGTPIFSHTDGTIADKWDCVRFNEQNWQI
jgi:hypothetical protein